MTTESSVAKANASTTLEICIDSIESALAAADGGADRLEVCSSLAVGGTTPSHGLVSACLSQTSLPVMMMIRPHDGGFVYGSCDIDVMLADIESAHALGVHGVVFGALTDNRRIDVEMCKRLVTASRPLSMTFHRAFDLVEDPLAALDQIINLGFQRVLTSGQAARAIDGVRMLQELNEHAGERITILAGSGINADNAAQIVANTGVRELHASASEPSTLQQSTSEIAFGGSHRITNADQVRAIKMAK